jgi:methionyl-tRNA formyltransferase
MKFKVIFCGTPDISAGILTALLAMETIEVVAVISQPDRPVGRKKELKPTPVKVVATEHNLPVLQPEKIGQAVEEIKAYGAQFLVTCAYGQIIPERVLNLFTNCVNVHASLLPKYRGGSPIQYAILNGEKETGISLMKMVKAMDAGEVYVQNKIGIADDDNSGTLFLKMEELGKTMITKYLPDILAQKIPGTAQDETGVTFAYNIVGDGEEIKWSKTAPEIHNFVRALTPKPIPFTTLNGERWKVGKTRLLRESEVFPMILKTFNCGEVVKMDKEGFWIYTGAGLIKVLEIQRPGKTMVSAGTFYNQNLINIGTTFGNEPSNIFPINDSNK